MNGQLRGDSENTAEAKKGKKNMWRLENTYTHLPGHFYSLQSPVPVRAPELVIFNSSLAKSLGLDGQALKTEEGIAVMAGNAVPANATPLAQAYAGHQFGHFTMLGDGRALLLGEQVAPSGARFDIQLKGSGRTAYSRRGDGRAALGPMLREYIISEAMDALGIPTTRSLAVVTTGEPVYRDTEQPGAILVRVAQSHLRVGTFEYALRWGSTEDLGALADYAIGRHFPDIGSDEGRYLSFLKGVVDRQASLIAKWQLAGFIHGVMNTDNMAISGETIDYGPCAFMDAYDAKTVFSSIDIHGRYAYGNQPLIAGWNLARFAETLLPLLHDDDEQAVILAQDAVSAFSGLYRSRWLSGMRKKLGLFNEEPEDESLVDSLLNVMQKHRADYTNTFLALTFDTTEDTALSGTDDLAQWLREWRARLNRQPQTAADSHQLMRRSNPALVPRNHRVEAALEAAVNHADYSVMEQLLKALADPYAHSCDQAEYAAPPGPSSRPYRTYCGT